MFLLHSYYDAYNAFMQVLAKITINIYKFIHHEGTKVVHYMQYKTDNYKEDRQSR